VIYIEDILKHFRKSGSIFDTRFMMWDDTRLLETTLEMPYVALNTSGESVDSKDYKTTKPHIYKIKNSFKLVAFFEKEKAKLEKDTLTLGNIQMARDQLILVGSKYWNENIKSGIIYVGASILQDNGTSYQVDFNFEYIETLNVDCMSIEVPLIQDVECENPLIENELIITINGKSEGCKDENDC
jgi:hypothetical protein